MLRNMKTQNKKHINNAFTLLELIVVIAIFVFFVLLLTPGAYHKGRPAYAAQCMSNQRQTALGLILFQSDHSGNYPWQVPATNGGSLDATIEQLVAPQFRSLASYLNGRMMVFICPTDASRSPATNFSKIAETNISYFLNVSASSTNHVTLSVLTGDRHLKINDKPAHAGSLDYFTNMNIGWTKELHGKSANAPLGVLAFGDGHCEVVKTVDLYARFQNQPSATNRLIIP